MQFKKSGCASLQSLNTGLIEFNISSSVKIILQILSKFRSQTQQTHCGENPGTVWVFKFEGLNFRGLKRKDDFEGLYFRGIIYGTCASVTPGSKNGDIL